MVINYLDVYINLNLRINKASDSNKRHITKNILKLQEWSSNNLRKRDENE